ncbi:hypothetical protein [Dokdonella sp.]|uniref:hypothetical protein n=1 Tax=Dokdonella sp. TaxID=2291710 RepID=UPI003C6B1E8B
MNVTILFGDREKKYSLEEIVQHAHAAVDAVIEPFRAASPSFQGTRPVWHSVAMQIDFGADTEYQQLLRAIEVNCALRRIAVMGVRTA